jgi:hypothetical protein
MLLERISVLAPHPARRKGNGSGARSELARSLLGPCSELAPPRHTVRSCETRASCQSAPAWPIAGD